jgi:predicted ferric reductase
MKKFVFWVIFTILLLLIPITIIQSTLLALAFRSPVTISNFVQRVLGLTAFTLMFVQLLLGAFMFRLVEKFGGWVFKFHLFEGIIIYSLALLHPIALMFFNHYIGIGWDPYRVFINACFICQAPTEFYYTLGIVSFWLLTMTVLAADFRAATPWFRVNWRKLHVFNYVVFLLVGLHGFLLGTDFQVQPFYTFAIIAYAIVVGVVIFIELPRLYKNFRKWIQT